MALTTVNSGGIKDDSIVNADIKSDAAIAKSKLASLDIVNTDINASAAIAGSKISPDFGSQNILTTGNITLTNTSPKIALVDSNNTSDFEVQNDNGNFNIEDTTNTANRLRIYATGGVNIPGHTDFGAGVDVTGDITLSNYLKASGDLLLCADYDNSLSGSALRFCVDGEAAAEKMRIDSSGRVGIGTNSPAQLLTVKGLSKFEATNSTNGWVNYTHTDNTYRFNYNGAGNDELILDSGGNVTVNDGNLVIGTAGHGIDFSAQTASGQTGATTGDEVLNHYETGSWTPTFNGASTAGTASANNVTGFYTKVGNLVQLTYYSSSFSMTGSAGTAYIQGLPFTAASGTGNFAAVSFAHTTAFVSAPAAYVNPSSVIITMLTSGSTTSANQFKNESSKYIMFSVVYRTT